MTLQVHVIEAVVDPSLAPDFVGQHWINTSSGRQWLAKGTSTAGDWAEVFSSSVLDEQIRDVIGASLVDSSEINFTYNDGADTITADLINSGVTAATYGSTTQVPQVAIDAKGRVTSASNITITPANIGAQPVDSDLTAISGLAGTGLIVRTGTGTATTRTLTASTGISVSNGDGVSGNPTISSTITQYTDELAQDAVGNILTDTASVDLTYNDGANTISAAVIPGGVDHNSLLNGGGNTHINHSSVSITAGTYLSGGGDITASRTINHANSAVTPATYGGVNAIPVLGIGATGHVDSASTVNPTDALLTGLASGTDTPIVSTDTLLAALANLQAQIDASSASQWTELVTTANIIVSSNTTLTNVTELEFSAVSGRRYYCEYTIIFRAAVTTTGIAFTIGTSDTAAGTFAAQVNIPIAADGTAAIYGGSISTLGDIVTSTGVQTAQPTWFVANIKGVFVCTTSGTVLPQFRSEVNGSNVNFGEGSVALIREWA